MSEINAIATNNYLLATQQEVSHDNTLSGNGTVDSPLGVVPGYNETVLYESTGASANINLSEPLSAFEKIEVSYYPQELANYTAFIEYFPGIDTSLSLAKWLYLGNQAHNPYVFYNTRYILSDNELTFNYAEHLWFNTAFGKAGNGNNPLMISKVVGINRKA